MAPRLIHKRPGPVHLELPEDIAAESCEEVALVAPHPVELPLAGAQALDRAAHLISLAKRPLAMLGAAASRPRSTSGIAQFVLRTRIPYFTTQMGKGTVPGGTELLLRAACLAGPSFADGVLYHHSSKEVVAIGSQP